MMLLKNKNVLVTGADGFIGSHLLEKLLEKNCHVRAFVYYNSFNHWGWIDSFNRELKDQIEIFTGDIRDINSVKNAMKNIHVVFHLAALISIPFSYVSPESYVDTNIKGTLNVLWAAKELGIEKTIVTSTSEVYGTARYVPMDELHPLQGQSPYAATKIGADHLAESFYRSFDLPVTIVRPFNTYGPRQSARAIIPTIICQLLAGSNRVCIGSILPKRDFNFVKDVTNGYIKICECDQLIGEVINIASQTEITIKELINEIKKLLNSNAEIITETDRLRPEKSEVGRLFGSNKKLKQYTDWETEYNLTKGLYETIDWLKDHYQHYKNHLYNI